MLPAYNAARTLRATVEDLPTEGIAEVILVDDASQDGTAELAETLGLTVIRHAHNLGYGGNQKTCYREALARGADIAVMVHPDHQYNPRMVPQLVDPIARGDCDAVLGSRMLGGRYFEGGMPRWKYCANITLTAAFNLTTGRFLTECHTGFRAYSRRYLTAVNFLANSDSFVFDVQILLQGIQARMRFYEIPIDTRYFAEASQVGFWAGGRYGLSILVELAAYRLHRMGLWTAAFLQRPSGREGMSA
ncbi:MAG: glycosyltransferase family 2 protein [Candidatus Methylomirabilales bacterium]